MTEPDWDKLRAACAELEAARSQGEVTLEQWGKAFERAREAVGEHTQFLEGILMQGAELGFVTLDG